MSMLKQSKLYWEPYRNISHTSIPERLQDWLGEEGSFMQRVRNKGVLPQIQVLNQCWGFPTLDEREQLNILTRSYALFREVLIGSENKNWMFARTVIPRETLTGKLKQLAHLRKRSLGSLLFNDPTLLRSEFEVTCLVPNTNEHEALTTYIKIPSDEPIWARRSLFYVQNKTLLLTEYFLPDILNL